MLYNELATLKDILERRIIADKIVEMAEVAQRKLRESEQQRQKTEQELQETKRRYKELERIVREAGLDPNSPTI
ncbi:hypothetical protein FACS1894200_07440 [Spirochaetia bacterium]|nr:hypothetical protein FACS1894200_07440 [Spirochaetia bacterium]